MILLSASGAAAIKTKHLEEEVNNKNSAFLQEFGEKNVDTVKTHKRGAYKSVMKEMAGDKKPDSDTVETRLVQGHYLGKFNKHGNDGTSSLTQEVQKAQASTGTSFLQFPSSGSSLLQVKLSINEETEETKEEAEEDWKMSDLETWQKIAICAGIALGGLLFWYIFWKCTKSCYCAFWVIMCTLVIEVVLVILFTDAVSF